MRHAVVSGLAVAPLPGSLIELRDGLPDLPEAELVTCFGPGGVLSSAKCLLELFEASC